MANPIGGSTTASAKRASKKRRKWPARRAAIAGGARALADRLDRELSDGGVVLHDRSVAAATGAIDHLVDHPVDHLVDHLVVASTGVWIIDAIGDTGRLERRNVGGFMGKDVRLIVGDHDRTSRIRAMGRQTDAIQHVLQPLGVEAVPLHRVLCFTDADWSRFARPFDVADVLVCRPRTLVSMVSESGPFDSDTIDLVAKHLDRELAVTR